MANGEEWLTVTQAAEISDFHPECIRELIREGDINAHKFGTVWAVYKTSLLEYLKKSQESGE
jgi:excisionase family DNA binding protein